MNQYSVVLLIWVTSFLSLAVSAEAFGAGLPCPSHPGLVLMKEHSQYCEFRGETTAVDPITHESRRIPYLYYFSRFPKAARAPLSLVYPSMTGEIPLVETLFSRELARNGYHALVVQLVEDISDLNRPPEQINDFFIRSDWSSSLLIDLAQTWSEVDPENVNAVGVSLGGIRATIAYGEDMRLKRVVAYVTGGNLPEIFAQSRVDFIVKYREFWKQKLGLATDEAFADYLRPLLKLDPLRVAEIRGGKNVTMILAKKDHKVPYPYQVELLHAFGDPEHVVMPFAHRITGSGFLYRFGLVKRALEKPIQ